MSGKQWAFHISVALVAFSILAVWFVYHIYFGRLS